MTTLSVIAGITKRARLVTGILLAALRRPVVLAKTAATLDVLSGAASTSASAWVGNARIRSRGTRLRPARWLLDHALEVCTALWTQPVAHYQSPELGFERIHMMPKPRQSGGVRSG